MALYADRVSETTTTTGTGTITLGGASLGYRAFSAAFTNGDTVRYTIAAGSEWEVGEGVYNAGTLTRPTILSSSNSGSAVSFSAGTKQVWCDIPAAALANLGSASSGAVLYRDSSGNIGGGSAVSITDSPGSITVNADNNSSVLGLTNYAPSSNGANILAQKARGTQASPTKALTGDNLGSYTARGRYEDSGGGFGPSTSNGLRFTAAEDYTSTSQGTNVVVTLAKPGTAVALEVLSLTGHGFLTLTGKTASTGSVPMFVVTGAAHTAQTASTELNDVLINLASTLQFDTGAITSQRSVYIKARTYSFVAASVITNAATLAIERAPVAGTNATITNAYSLWCVGGKARFDGGLDATHVTETGIVSDSASTGTVNNLTVAATTSIIRFTNATPPTLTGLAVTGGNVAGRRVTLVSTTGNITIKSEITSTAANQFKTNGAADITILQYEYMTFIYDGGKARWMRMA